MQIFELIGGDAEASSLFLSGTDNYGQGNLFDEIDKNQGRFYCEEADAALVAALHSASGVDISTLPYNSRRLYELSANAFDSIVRAWMSELPITTEIIRFGQKVLATTGRQAAHLTSTDRGDPNAQTVEAAAYKVWHEYDRLRGFLRFNPDENGVYVARCEPDHFVLPAFGPHFRERFGQTPWAIIDVKRNLCLCGEQGQMPVLNDGNKNEQISGSVSGGDWENLWRHYHKTINNESRNNPGLQPQFMPKRYRKYLTEL